MHGSPSAHLKSHTTALLPRITSCRSRLSVSVISIVLVFSVREEWPSFESVKQRDFYSRHSSQESRRWHCLILVHNLSLWRQAISSRRKPKSTAGQLPSPVYACSTRTTRAQRPGRLVIGCRLVIGWIRVRQLQARSRPHYGCRIFESGIVSSPPRTR